MDNERSAGLRGGLNFYEYAGNDPGNYIDPTGLSFDDAWKMKVRFDQAVEEMTKAGKRAGAGVGQGWLNNLIRAEYNVSFGLFGRKHLGCEEQAWVALSAVNDSNQHYDDKWTFEIGGGNLPQPSFDVWVPGPHYWVTATSSNPADPRVVLDPWQDLVKFIPPSK